MSQYFELLIQPIFFSALFAVVPYHLAEAPEPKNSLAALELISAPTPPSDVVQNRSSSPPPTLPPLQPPPTPVQPNNVDNSDSEPPEVDDSLFSSLERDLRPAVDLNPATKWSADKVHQWLTGIEGIGKDTLDLFSNLKIDGFTLVRLSEEDLRAEGVALPARKRLLEAVQRLTTPLDAAKEVAKFMEHSRRYLRPQQLVLISILKDAGTHKDCSTFLSVLPVKYSCVRNRGEIPIWFRYPRDSGIS